MTSAIHTMCSLHRAEQAMRKAWASIKTEAGASISLRQAQILAAVVANPGARQDGLVRLTGIDRSTLSEVMQRLIANGLVTRHDDDKDGRAYSIFATDSGHAAMEAAERAAASVLQQFPDLRALARSADASLSAEDVLNHAGLAEAAE